METPVRKLQVLKSEPGVEPEVWELAPEAHEYNLENYTKFLTALEEFLEGKRTDEVEISLLLHIWVLAPKNGPDAAKRLHLLEGLGAEFKLIQRYERPKEDEEEEVEDADKTGKAKAKPEKKPKKEKEIRYQLDMHLNGRVLKAADLVPQPWWDEIQQRLALHREYAKQSETLSI